jgi:glycosyltransferase involved in cell wall biosynthesis
MINAPRVTLAMPVYNGENFIQKAIESILAQTFGEFELVVSDNASSDLTREIVKSYQQRDRRIRLVENTKNIGAAANYNVGFMQAKGEFLKWCAHDDEIDPGHVATLVEKLDSDTRLTLAYGKTICIDEAGQEIPMIGAEMPEILDQDAVKRFMRAIKEVGTCFPTFGLFRRDALQKTTLHKPYYGSDRALLAEVALMGRLGCAPEAIFYNREHGQRSINIIDKLDRSAWQNGSKSRSTAAEHLNLLRHFFEISGRHPDITAPLRLRLALLRYAAEPYQLGRYAMECAGLVSPGTARFLKRTADMLSGRKKNDTDFKLSQVLTKSFKGDP